MRIIRLKIGEIKNSPVIKGNTVYFFASYLEF
uniref:Uncharacterized protein n=1 Tax=Phage sp. ctHEp8 TaxID=2825790 RepID=A0A8S5TY34_9VIRU|nr:MAG TPA: hypothetical protein [Phage sp. ctHEp8]